MDDQPRSVKDLLVEAKDVSDLMVDLAYAAVFFEEEKLAREVERLRDRMYETNRLLRTMAVLAARSREDAEAIESVLQIASAIEKIGEAAADIARVVEANLGIPEALRPDLRHADEVSGRVKTRRGAGAIGRALRDLSLPTETGVWIMAIRRGADWDFSPSADTMIAEGDVLLFRGPEEGIDLIRGLAGAPPLPTPDPDGPVLSELDRAVDILVEMKDASEAAVGLAYSCLLFQDPALAAEVGTLEAQSDVLQDELESWVLRAAPEARRPDELRGLLRVASATESICDAAREMTWYVEKGEQMHPVVAMALEETEETTVEAQVVAGSPADGRTLKELRVETETGMFVLAVQRGRRWIYRPRPAFGLRAGDRLIALGPEEGERELADLCGMPTDGPVDGDRRAHD
ncbi:MAG: TrkA C-terminal domain-containing protein [Actinomycetota bacterium]